MADTVDKKTRSRMMAAVKGKNTSIEIALRRALFALGYRYRLHGRTLPGRPDIVLPKHNAAIFIHGCFWHGHDDCQAFCLPKTRKAFWRKKIERNKERDLESVAALAESGWRVMTVWECAMRRGKTAETVRVAEKVDRWLRGNRKKGEIRK